MNKLITLLFVVLAFASTPLHAALSYSAAYYPTTGPGGLSTPYPAGNNPQVYAGMYDVSHGGSNILVFPNLRDPLVSVGDFWSETVYTYADVQAGHGRFAREQYARVGYVLDSYFNNQTVQFYPSLRAVAEAWGNDTLAFVNAQVWDIMSSPSCPINVLGCSAQTDTFDWSNLMVAIEPTGSTGDPWIAITNGQHVSGVPTASTPVPPAIWLLGSGLLGLVGVARRSSKK